MSSTEHDKIKVPLTVPYLSVFDFALTFDSVFNISTLFFMITTLEVLSFELIFYNETL